MNKCKWYQTDNLSDVLFYSKCSPGMVISINPEFITYCPYCGGMIDFESKLSDETAE